MDLTLVIAIALLLLILLVAVVLPRRLDSQGNYLGVVTKGLVDDYFLASTENDIEKKRLRLHKLTIATDRVLSQIMTHFGARDHSVKQQLRQALDRNIITYDQFRALKEFHHMRNEVVHEGLQVFGDNEQTVYAALVVMKKLISR